MREVWVQKPRLFASGLFLHVRRVGIGTEGGVKEIYYMECTVDSRYKGSGRTDRFFPLLGVSFMPIYICIKKIIISNSTIKCYRSKSVKFIIHHF